MKQILKKIISVVVLLIPFALSSCMEEQQVDDATENDEVVMRITANLSGEEALTRLDYYESGKALKAVWSHDDKLVANAQPATTSYYFIFDLVEGAGTPTGVFECVASTTGYLPHYISTNAWTIYFPGSRILCEKDYLDFLYDGQVQKGDADMRHLKDYHTIRLACTDGSMESANTFQDAYVDFSGEDYDESSCMKFNLSGLPSIVPTELRLEYTAPAGSGSQCFHMYNYIESWWGSGNQPNPQMSNSISIRLEDFEPCTSATVYVMMSNYPVSLKAGGKLNIKVRSEDGRMYECSKVLRSDVTLLGGKLHSISGSEWTENTIGSADGFDDPDKGIVLLQEASKGKGADIVIMGDGFSKAHFEPDGNYDKVMRQAYEDFFSVEPYASLKDYFNVFYINAVSEDDHDATPLVNGAVQGNANTVFSTAFTPNSTDMRGDGDAVLSYAEQAIRYKGGAGGSRCTDENEVRRRAQSSLMIVMANVECHAGTCVLSYSYANDYCAESSVAYCALSTSLENRRLTLLHEAGGHGFGKLADEYGVLWLTSFSISDWNNLINLHHLGLYRNVNEHWTAEEKNDGWSVDLRDEYTSQSNVYWSELLSPSYDYRTDEGLGIYRGAFCYHNLYCRPTVNSVMRDQFADEGDFFNAISRWAIWYRLMRVTECTSADDFKSSLDEFIMFDRTLNMKKASRATVLSVNDNRLLPLAPPVLVERK